MSNKKHILILLLLVITAIGTISSVSANDSNATDALVIEQDASEIAVDNDACEVITYEVDDFNAGDNNADEGDSSNEYDSIITVTESGTHANDKVFKAKLTDMNGNPLSNKEIWFYTEIKKEDVGWNFNLQTIKTNANGVATYKWDQTIAAGTYTMSVTSWDTYADEVVMDNVVIPKLSIKIKPTKLTTTYKSGKTFNVKVVDSESNPVKGVKLTLKVYTGKKYKTVTVTTDSKGVAKYKASKLSKGTHTIKISAGKGFSYKTATSKVVIKPKSLVVLTESYYTKNCGGIDIGIGDKSTEKLINGIKVKVKVYTGKKYKTYTLVTGYDKQIYKSDGICGLETSALSVGTHKVKITIVSKNYKGSATAVLKIPKTAKNYSKYTYLFSKGKGKYV